MIAATPHDLPWLLLDALNSGDVDRVVALYEPRAVLASSAIRIVTGHDAIRAATARLFAQGSRFALPLADVFVLDDVSMARCTWIVTRSDTGNAADVSLNSVLTMRRHEQERWLIAIERSERQEASARG